MGSSRITVGAPSTLYSVSVDFTFKGVAIGGAGTYLPINWAAGLGLLNWSLSFATVPGTGTLGAFAINCPDLTYLPDQTFGWILAGTLMVPISLASGVMSATVTLTQGARITVIGQLSQSAIVNL